MPTIIITEKSYHNNSFTKIFPNINLINTKANLQDKFYKGRSKELGWDCYLVESGA